MSRLSNGCPRILRASDAHHRDLHSFPTRRSSDLNPSGWRDRPPFLCAAAATPRISPSATARTRPRGSPTPSQKGLFAERSEEHTSELQSRVDLVCRLLLEKKKKKKRAQYKPTPIL